MAQATRRPARRRPLIALTAALTLALAATLATGPAESQAAPKGSQPSCGKFAKQVRKATSGTQKRAAKAAQKQCLANMQVFHQVKDSHFYGYRADGVKIDTIYCANGKMQDDVETGGEVRSGGWQIVGAKVGQGGKKLTAVVETKIPGGTHVQALIRDGEIWQVGWEWDGEAREAGTVEKRSAKAVCKTL